ncbi:hypothetical protein ACL02P_15290 [Paenibacillus sp. MB22_1]|uniref:hypothetical protein n=1 Tax=Paenibacillus sp. MB22_1 TaxID=3383121 RepID=UPI0039A00FAD
MDNVQVRQNRLLYYADKMLKEIPDLLRSENRRSLLERVSPLEDKRKEKLKTYMK